MSLLLALTGERLFYVIYDSTLAGPTADQIRDGKDSTGAYAVAWDNVDPPANGVFDWPTDAVGLTLGNTYRVAFTHQSPATLVVVSDPFTTVVSGRLKFWNGSAWVLKSAKQWNGAAWAAKPVKFWNGSTWA